MPHLNWKNQASIRINLTPHPTYQSQLELGLTPELAVALADELSQAFAPGGAELRVDLPEQWTLFWKSRAGSSRLQLAHPQATQWVATLNLTDAHGQAVIQGLRALNGPGPGLVLTQLGPMAPIVNFELVISAARP